LGIPPRPEDLAALTLPQRTSRRWRLVVPATAA
jgi:hypothetical protein